jgi:hypothetical protein
MNSALAENELIRRSRMEATVAIVGPSGKSLIQGGREWPSTIHLRWLKAMLKTRQENLMKNSIRLMIVLAAMSLWTTVALAQELKVGDMAPDFTLKASDGKTYTLSSLRGKTVVLAWFPKAFTAG